MPERRITQIPLPGGSNRAPTGAMQFQNDWPGLFLRGDSAIPMAVHIRELERRLVDHPDGIVGGLLVQLSTIAEMIERDVLAKNDV